MTTQLNLFGAERPAPERRPPDPMLVRKHLMRLVRIACDAQWLPWPAAEADDWEMRFPRLADHLPAEEAESLKQLFVRELARLRPSAS